MSDGELSSKKTSEGGSSAKGDATGQAPATMGAGSRFRVPTSSQVEGPAFVPDDDDDTVNQLAKRFRSGPRLGRAVVEEATSLDQQDHAGGSDVDAGSLLAALDISEEFNEPGTAAAMASFQDVDGGKTEAEEIPMVNVEPMESEAQEASPEEATTVCPSCHAENPVGMRFCVECGGSLEAAVAKSSAALDGDLSGSVDPSASARREPPPPTKAAKQENPWEISLVSINEDGSDGRALPLKFLETTVGRDGDSRFPTDAFLSPKHSRFHIEKGVLYVEDLYSLNGTFIKLREETRLTPGDTILMGRQVLRFERFEQSITPKTKSSDGTRYMGSPAPGGSFKILQIGIGGVVQNVYCLPEAGAVLGREKGDIVFPHDKFMSGRHAQIYTGDDGHCYLVDLNSSNGTWIKLWEKTELHKGDYLFMGQQLFRVDYGE